MLNIINNLSIFFEDCYREISVREYSRIIKISPPTASKILKEMEKGDLLKKRIDRNFIFFRANRENNLLKDLSRIYWKGRFERLIDYINLELNYPTIVLFGSLSKLEIKKDSDIDLAIFTQLNKKINIQKFEKDYKREIQIFFFKDIKNIKGELRNNIINGYILEGEIK